jgi:mRNA interferase RelE/StbE
LAWTIEWDKRAVKELKKLSKPVRREVLNYLNMVAKKDNPRCFGKTLHHDLKGLWRYRVAGVYRIVCKLEDEHFSILVVRTSHRRHVYI